ncbi:MAG: hypothetical protein LBL41_01945 [Bifidobacteriaceae bacterium]|jgi:hypothetical protein|nr:hypothetical protein [Bifidobacteriaceae bacterium]
MQPIIILLALSVIGNVAIFYALKIRKFRNLPYITIVGDIYNILVLIGLLIHMQSGSSTNFYALLFAFALTAINKVYEIVLQRKGLI